MRTSLSTSIQAQATWVIVDLGAPEFFGQTVVLRAGDMVGGFRALHMLPPTKDYVVCMRRAVISMDGFASWADKQMARFKKANGIVAESPAVLFSFDVLLVLVELIVLGTKKLSIIPCVYVFLLVAPLNFFLLLNIDIASM